MADSGAALGKDPTQVGCSPFNDVESVGALGTPVNAGMTDGNVASEVEFAGGDCTPLNALDLATVTASGKLSGELAHCAATRPAEGPFPFGV